MPRFARSILSLFLASSSSLPLRSSRPASFFAASAFAISPASPPTSRSTCTSSASTMAPIAESTASSLPRWDLSRFGFATPHSEDIDSHLDETAKLAEAFKAKYEGKLGESSLLLAIEEYEKISIRKTTISSYLHLSYDTLLYDDSLKKRKGALSQRQSEIYGDNLEWFSLDVAELDDAVLAKQ